VSSSAPARRCATEPRRPVTFQPQVTCGVCHPCRHGAYHICDRLKVMDSRPPGPLRSSSPSTRRSLAPAEAMSMEQGAMVEPLAVASMRSSASWRIRKKCWCSGGTDRQPGGPGGARARSCRVMITDTSDYRLELAERCGIPLRVNPLKVDLGEPSGNDSGGQGRPHLRVRRRAEDGGAGGQHRPEGTT